MGAAGNRVFLAVSGDLHKAQRMEKDGYVSGRFCKPDSEGFGFGWKTSFQQGQAQRRPCGQSGASYFFKISSVICVILFFVPLKASEPAWRQAGRLEAAGLHAGVERPAMDAEAEENRAVVSGNEAGELSVSAGIAEVGIEKKERISHEEADTLEIWSMADCMRYAAEHSYAVRKQMYETNSYKAERDRAIASFFPSLSAGIGGTMNWGRSIDPNTNTYTTQQSFANNYDLGASMPLFAGGQYVKQWMLAASNLKMGQNDIARLKDEAAMNAMQAFVDVVYYRETVRLSKQNLEDSRRNLYKTEQEEALGLKGKADVAQFRSQVAAADYQLTSQQNLYNASLLTLKQVMNFPLDKPLVLDSVFPYLDLAPVLDNPDLLFEAARETNPQALQARYQFRAAQLSYKMSIGAMMPSISVSGGLNTSYIGGLRDLNNRLMRFDEQFKNNWGGYVSVSMNIPIFSGLYSNTALRKAKNDMMIARESQDEALRQLHDAVTRAVMDCNGYAKEAVQMRAKVESDSISYRLTLRKYEEGLMSPLDVQASANTLLQSRADYLQKVLLYVMRWKTVAYYRGESLY